MSCVETDATTETIIFPGFISGLILFEDFLHHLGLHSQQNDVGVPHGRTIVGGRFDAQLLGESARLFRVAHRGMDALRLHQLLLQECAQQNSANLSGAQHGQPLVRK